MLCPSVVLNHHREKARRFLKSLRSGVDPDATIDKGHRLSTLDSATANSTAARRWLGTRQLAEAGGNGRAAQRLEREGGKCFRSLDNGRPSCALAALSADLPPAETRGTAGVSGEPRAWMCPLGFQC